MVRLNCYKIRASEGHWLAPDADFNLIREKLQADFHAIMKSVCSSFRSFKHHSDLVSAKGNRRRSAGWSGQWRLTLPA